MTGEVAAGAAVGVAAADGGRRRRPGLDTLRALAIALVFLYHYSIFVDGAPTFGWVGHVGWVGVDLFFVLSGYLIGNQLFAGLQDNRQRLSLTAFYARRALRTWPVFWVVLAAYFAFPALMDGRRPAPPLWAFLTFTQNWQLQPGTAFSHAWSLCIEEQFYLLLPLVVLAGTKLLPLRASARARGRFWTTRTGAWTLLAALACAGIAARAVLWRRYGLESSGHAEQYHPQIYYATLCRFDEFLPGVAIALLRRGHPAAWRRVQAAGGATFAAGFAAVAAALYGAHVHYDVPGVGHPFFMTVFGYSAIAAAFALLVASALSDRSPLHRVRVPGARVLALWSYPIYLSHKAVAHIVQANAAALPPAWQQPLLQWLLTVAAVLVVGWALHVAVEAPCMRLRERRFARLFAAAPGAATTSAPAQATVPAPASSARPAASR